MAGENRAVAKLNQALEGLSSDQQMELIHSEYKERILADNSHWDRGDGLFDLFSTHDRYDTYSLAEAYGYYEFLANLLSQAHYELKAEFALEKDPFLEQLQFTDMGSFDRDAIANSIYRYYARQDVFGIGRLYVAFMEHCMRTTGTERSDMAKKARFMDNFHYVAEANGQDCLKFTEGAIWRCSQLAELPAYSLTFIFEPHTFRGDENEAVSALQHKLDALGPESQKDLLMKEFRSRILIDDSGWILEPKRKVIFGGNAYNLCGFFQPFNTYYLSDVYDYYEFLAQRLSEAGYDMEARLAREKDPLLEQMLYTTDTPIDWDWFGEGMQMYFKRDDSPGFSRLYRAYMEFSQRSRAPDVPAEEALRVAEDDFRLGFETHRLETVLRLNPKSRIAQRCIHEEPDIPTVAYDRFAYRAMARSTSEGNKPYGISH